ncbi:MAG: hypothetical protein ACI9F9_000323 [Candidatus Paceibacteria bacterium]
MRGTFPFTLRILRVLLLALGCASCGYSSGVRLPGDAKTLGIAFVENDSPFPELEREFYATLTTQASRMVTGVLVAPSRAEVVIRGTIDDYRRLHGTQSALGQLQESGIRIRAHAWLESGMDGERIGAVLHFDQAVRYIITVREDEGGARRSVIQNICEEMVLDLFAQPDEAPEPPDEIPTDPLVEDLD